MSLQRAIVVIVGEDDCLVKVVGGPPMDATWVASGNYRPEPRQVVSVETDLDVCEERYGIRMPVIAHVPPS